MNSGSSSKKYRISHPAAHWKRHGSILVAKSGDPSLQYRYLLSDDADRVPLQRYAWRRAEVVVGPAGLAPPTATLISPHIVRVDWRIWDKLYGTGPPLDLSNLPVLAQLLGFHGDAVLASAATGNDWGNVTTYDATQTHGGILGMNRLNHCPAIFFEAMRDGDRAAYGNGPCLVRQLLRFVDLVGTQENWAALDTTISVAADEETPPEDDTTFMWRSDDAVDFCTKGFVSRTVRVRSDG